MSLLTIVLVLIVVGVLLYVVTTHIPMEPTIRKIIIALVVIVTVVWLLRALGVWHHLSAVRL